MTHYKYSRTYHVPWSKGTTSDDRILPSIKHFEGRQVVVTEKLDGECLDENTKITTNIGEITIKEICNNPKEYKVLGYDLESEICSYQTIDDCLVTAQQKEWFEIELENEVKLKITGDHLVWLPKLNCYRRVDEIQPGDFFLLKN